MKKNESEWQTVENEKKTLVKLQKKNIVFTEMYWLRNSRKHRSDYYSRRFLVLPASIFLICGHVGEFLRTKLLLDKALEKVCWAERKRRYVVFSSRVFSAAFVKMHICNQNTRMKEKKNQEDCRGANAVSSFWVVLAGSWFSNCFPHTSLWRFWSSKRFTPTVWGFFSGRKSKENRTECTSFIQHYFDTCIS